MTRRGHLFTVQILIEEETGGKAMEKLLHLLNVPDIVDYKILHGIELGLQIDQALEAARTTPTAPRSSFPSKPEREVCKAKHAFAPAPADRIASSGSRAAEPDPAAQPERESDLGAELTKHQNSGRLIRLFVVKGKGVKLSLPCRILKFDVPSALLTVYHVDEKQVYTFALNEIEDIQANV